MSQSQETLLRIQQWSSLALSACLASTYRLASDLLAGTLAPTHTARYDGDSTISTCLPNTRVGLLEKLVAWAKDPKLAPILWLSGLAGTGKSTVAKTFCERLSGSMKIVSFFISRYFDDRKTSRNVLNSLVHQLGNCDARLKAALVAAYESDPYVATRPLAKEPLKALGSITSPIIIVIDALDECDMEDGHEGGQLLSLLADVARRLPHTIKLLVTSREEPTIKNTFEEMRNAHDNHNTVRLHMIEEHIVSSDIHHFLLYRLRGIAARYLGQSVADWPSGADLAELVRRAGVLFVYAATVIRFLDDRNFNPRTRLRQIIDENSKSSDDSSPYSALDSLYLEVLNKAVGGSASKDNALCARVRILVNTLVLLQYPLDPTTLSQLLDIDAYDINVDVSNLSAVLMVPEVTTDTVKIFHLSFPDYVLRRCGDERFTVDAEMQHGFILRRCIGVMKKYLKEDICQIGGSSLLNSEVKDLPERLREYVPSELRYACQHWITHLSHSSPDEILINELEYFCSYHLLHWLEALSLLDALPSILRSLPNVLEWCKVSFSASEVQYLYQADCLTGTS
jgi:hypothetical protein